VRTLAGRDEALRRATARILTARTGTIRMGTFTVVLSVASLAIAWLLLRDRPAPFTAAGVPWVLVVAVLYAAAETFVVRLHLGRSAHSFSMTEVPLILGLFFLDPPTFLAARLVGAGLALVIGRRQRPVKLAFNLSQFMLSSVVALAVFRLPAMGPPVDLLSGPQVLGPAYWLGALLATWAEGLVGVVAVSVAMSLAEGSSQLRRIPDMLASGTIVGMTNASLVLLALTVLAVNPLAAGLVAIPLVTAFLAYRAYVAQRKHNEGLEMLYRSTRILQLNPQLDDALQSLLQHARRTFRADIAEITLLPGGGSGDLLRITAGPGDATGPIRAIGPDFDDPLLGQAVNERRVLMVPATGRDGGATAADDERFRDAMVGPLIGASRTVGALVVANRLSDISSFDPDDLTMFEALVNHTALALETGQVEQSLAALADLKEELDHQANHDALTGLANRTHFSERIDARLAERAPGGSIPVVIFLDLDDFKLVNDALGHAAGDALLVAVAERIRGALQPGDVAARIGGDEFGILLSDRPGLIRARSVADRLLATFGAAYIVTGSAVQVGASIGVAAAEPEMRTADHLTRNADVAMYSAKARGKGRVAVFEPDMAVAVATRHQLTASLQRAVAAGEFVLHYQPIVELDGGGIVAVEALLRWEDPFRGTVGPSEFIALAEESDIILRVGRWVLEQACVQAAAWEGRFAGSGRARMAVNISTRQLQQPGFVDDVLAIIRASGVAPEAIALEMTETGMLADIGDTVSKLRRLRSAGLGISVDDFGTGYSSLSYLRRFPVTSLKIARDFVDVDETQPESWELAGAIVSLGNALRLEVVAEGVEHLYQLNRLRELGCGLAQGYYLARPAGVERIQALLAGSEAAPARIWKGPRTGIALAAPPITASSPAARTGA
jgi:diguanylate cyclase (GGDEF)-like protein